MTTSSSGRAVDHSSATLRLEGITKTFGGVVALAEVSFDVSPGEVVALVGDNGAGKSTTVKIISGNLSPDAGVLHLGADVVQLSGPQHASSLGIATVYQDLALCDNLNAVANVFLGQELRRRIPPRLKRAAMEERAAKVFAEMNLVMPSLKLPVGRLSGGQRQAVAISRVLLREPRIILLDEPTAALGVAQRGQVIELIERLREQRKGVLLISHDLGDVTHLADRVVVLRLGRVAARFTRGQYTTEDLVAAITGAHAASGRSQL
jgi:D-xylose transport system ATP-binding protein